MRKLLLLICIFITSLQLSAQTRAVTGKVTDENGNALTGVTIRVPSTTQYTITKNDGTFSLSVPANVTQLEFSSVGYTNQTISVRGLNNISVNLVSSTKSL